jgi:hypothetical protein
VSTWLVNATDDEWFVYELADGFSRGKLLTALKLDDDRLDRLTDVIPEIPGQLGLEEA